MDNKVIETENPLYSQEVALWEKAERFFLGGDVVRRYKTLYLPKMSIKQDNEQYENLLAGAPFYPSVAQCVEKAVGRMFSGEIAVSNVDTADLYLDGTSFNDILTEMMEDTLLCRHGGFLIDADPVAGAYIRYYKTVQVIDWQYDELSATKPLTMVKLKEVYDDLNPTTGMRGEITRIRTLTLEDGVYTQTIHDKKGATKYSEILRVQPTVRGQTLDFIPFIFVSGGRQVRKAPVRDLTYLNEQHYRLSAYHTAALRATNTPFLALNGIPEEDLSDIVVGDSKGFVISQVDTDRYYQPTVEWIEPSGNGINGYVQELERLEKQMSNLANDLVAPKDQVESQEVVERRREEALATLNGVIEDINTGMTSVLSLYNQISGVSATANFEINIISNTEELPEVVETQPIPEELENDERNQ